MITVRLPDIEEEIRDNFDVYLHLYTHKLVENMNENDFIVLHLDSDFMG